MNEVWQIIDPSIGILSCQVLFNHQFYCAIEPLCQAVLNRFVLPEHVARMVYRIWAIAAVFSRNSQMILISSAFAV
jgi:hypothetical protein